MAGDELEVESIEVEEERACIASRVRVVEDALDANNTIARANRADFDRHGVTVVNLMSAPGAGKTTLLERAARRRARRACGSACSRATSQGSLDADGSRSLHVPVTQLNTDPGFGGECHLDANMVRSALPELPLDEIDLLVIENVGNLVCPAEFRVGEDVRVMVSSVTEGEDKPLKYPLMFRTCELVLVNKIDLLPHLDVDLDRFLHNLDAVHPDVRAHARERQTGEGVEEWRDWLGRLSRTRARPRRMTARRARPTVRRRRDRAARLGVLPSGTRRTSASSTREAGRIARALPPGRRAVRARRPAAGDRAARPPARSDVRHVAVEFVHPGDRRQAGAAGDRHRGRVGLRARRRSGCSPRPDDIVIAFGGPPTTRSCRRLSSSRDRAAA